jgi:hypothetical protein
MSSAALAVIAALGASLLTGVFSVGVVWFQQWKRERAASAAALEQALQEVLARSWSIAMRVGTMTSAAQLRTPAVDDNLRVLLRMRRPLDHFELHDWLAQDWAPMVDAMAVIWARGNQRAIQLANAVVNCCGEFQTIPPVPEPRGLRALFGLFVEASAWPPEVLRQRETRLKELAEARKALANFVREHLDQPRADVFETTRE